MKAQRLLIVNADEFGRNPGINRGVIDTHRRGIVTSASAMVRRPAAVEAARLVRENPALGVGLHVDLCEWVCRDGRWVQVEEVVPLDDADAVSEEVARQLSRFRELFQREPTHLDSHQNVHRTEPVRSVLLTTARQLGVPLRHFTDHVFVCSEFHGQTSTGRPYPEGIRLSRLLAVLRSLPEGASELICHPGYGDSGAGSYGRERETELQVLSHRRVRETLREQGLELGTFADVPATGSLDPEGTENSFRARGRAAFDAGEFEKAVVWFRRAAAVGGERPWPWLWLARSQMQMGDLEGSRDSIERALGVLPGWPPGLLHLADLHMEAKEVGAASRVLEEVAAGLGSTRNGDGDGVARAVARRITRLPEPETANQVADALLAGCPDEATAIAAKAVALARTEDSETGRRFLHSVPGCQPEVRWRAAAEFHLEADDPLQAWRHLREIDLGEEDGPLVSRTAQALRRCGELTRAWEAFDRAAALGVSDPSLRHWRDVVLGEVQVLSGSWRAQASGERHYESVDGRILHLVGKSLPYVQTGYSVRTRYITLAQRDAGLHPEVATQLGFPWDQGTEEAPLSEELDGILHHRIPGPHPLPARLDDRLDRNIAELRRLVRRRRPMILHAHSDYRNALLALALRDTFQVPVVYEVRGFWEETWRSKQPTGDPEEAVAYRWRQERELECMLAADGVVTLAEVMKEQLVARGVPEGKIHVIPNAVDPQAFRTTGPQPELARRLGIEEHDVVLGYVSSFTPYEGIHHLIEAVAILAEEGLPVRGLLVGDGKERERLEARARELGVADRVVFTGRVAHDHVAAMYGLIDVFVVPRTGDRVCRLVTPLKPYEAMAMERAVVVSGVEALKEMIVPGVTGLTFEPEDSRDLARVARPLVRSPERRRELGRAAREWVSTHRTWSRNGRLYDQLVRTLVPEAVRRSPPDLVGSVAGRGRR